MKNSIRLLAIDIDGTLLDSQWKLPRANRDAITAAAALGIEIVLVTGRRFTFARPIAEQLPVEWTLIASNGAVVKSQQGQTLARRLLPCAHALAVLSAAGEHRHTALLLFDRDGPGQIVTESLDPSHAPIKGYFERNRAYLRQVKRLEDVLADSVGNDDPIQVLFAGAFEPMRALTEQLELSPSRVDVNITRTEYPDRDFTLVDVLNRQCNKGTALADWARRRSIPTSQVMAIGDNWNDLEMLEFAGLPVVMGNSAEKLKRKGWAVTAGNNEDGVARAIEKLLLKN